MTLLLKILVSFYIYAFLGWCVEVAFVAVTSGKVVNRGFLNGPVCPIYGVGMIGILLALTPLKDNALVLFVGGAVICSALELFTGWILDKIFHMRWWDYSDQPFNVGGYICLGFSIMWGIGSMIMVAMIHPIILSAVKKVPMLAIYIVLVIVTIAFIVDLIVTVKNIIGIKKSFGQLDKIATGLNEIGNQIKDVVGNSAITVSEKTEQGKEKIAEATAESREKIAEVTVESREKIVAATVGGKEKIAAVTSEGKDKIVAATTGGKEKFAAVTAESRDKIVEATAESREKIAEAYEASIVELKKQKMELEAKYAAMLIKIQKQSRRQIKAFPKLRFSSSSISIKEKINDLIRK